MHFKVVLVELALHLGLWTFTVVEEPFDPRKVSGRNDKMQRVLFLTETDNTRNAQICASVQFCVFRNPNR